jgi:hypothetical protein
MMRTEFLLSIIYTIDVRRPVLRPMYCSNNDKDDCTLYETRTRVGMPPLEWWGLEELLYNHEGTTAYSASPTSFLRFLMTFKIH